MKHKFLSVFLALLMLSSLFAGCGKEPQPQETTHGTQGTPSTQPADPTGTTVPTQPPEPEPTDLFSLCGQGEFSVGSPMPDYVRETDTPHLYACDISLEESRSGSVQVSADVLMMFHWEYDNYCDLYDLYSGTFGQRVYLSRFVNWGTLADGGLWTLELPYLQVRFYDADGQVTEVFAREEAIPEDRLFSHGVVTRDGRYLAVAYEEGSLLELYDLQTGSVKLIPVPEQLNAWYLTEYGEGFLVVDFENVCYLDLESGQLQPWSSGETLGTLYNGVFQHYGDNVLILDSGATGESRFYMGYEYGESLLDLNFGCAMTEVYGTQARLRFYDLRKECLLTDITLPDVYYSLTAQFLSDGRAIIANQTEDGLKLFLYDLPAAAAEAEGTPVSVLYASEEQLLEEADAIAASVLEQTGVELFYGSEGNDFILYDYLGAVQLDPYEIYRSVKTAGELLSKYPEGMLREAYELTHDGLRIYLCGEIYGIHSAALSNAGGVTSEYDGDLIIALHATSSMSYDLPHELSHVFDRRINHTDYQSGSDWMNLWDNATPLSDGYVYDYENYYQNTKYTPDHGESEVWFIDSYARSFPTEDRARLMEHMANHDEEFSAELLRYENLNYKARLYAYILRQCFPSCDTDQVHFWEEGLGVIGDSLPVPPED